MSLSFKLKLYLYTILLFCFVEELLQKKKIEFQRYKIRNTQRGVERALEDRVTGWRGWHHHTTMVMLAMLYLLTVKEALGEHAENRTLKDALWIVEGIVPRRELTDEEKIAIILENPANRERSRRIRLEAQLKTMELEGIVVRDAF